MNIIKLSLILSVLLIGFQANAQIWDPVKKCVTDANGECLPNTLLTAVPFLRIVPDARSGGMGDAGIAISPDPSAMHFNASKLAFVEDDLSLSATYTPWLRELGLDDIYLAYLAGYKKIDELSTLGFGLRFFSLGEINFTDINGKPTGTGRPREMDLSLSYARKLSNSLSAGLTGKYIYSNLASGQSVGGVDISVANAFAADLSLTWTKEMEISEYDSKLTIGAAATNLGSKISYTQSQHKDFLPGNFGIGAALEMDFDDYNTMTFAIDINKLLVPTPVAASDSTRYDVNPKNGVPDFREQGLFSSITGSFSDAASAAEEFKEIYYSAGVEYWYDKQFAVRAGYYYEHPLKGDRQFLTLGLGLKYNVFGMNLSYLVSTSGKTGQNPLINTLRFSLLFDFEAIQGAE